MFAHLLHVHTPSPSLISLMVSVDVKHHVCSLTADGHAWMSWAGDHDSETRNNLAPLQSSCNFHKSLAIRCHLRSFLSKYLSMQRHVRLQLQLPNKLCANLFSLRNNYTFFCCFFQVRDQFCSNKTASQFILLLFCRFCNFKTCKSCNYKGVRLFKSCDAVNFAFRFGSCESTVGKLSL